MSKHLSRHSSACPLASLFENLEPRTLLSASSAPTDLIAFNGRVFFTADDGIHGRELFVSNGTPAGTSMLKDINPGQAGSNIRNFTVAGGKLFFSATDGSKGQELWMTDGTPTGTKLVKDVFAGSGSSNPSGISAFGSSVYFSASTSANGNEVWKSDGVATLMVADIAAGAASSNPANFTVVGSNVFFTAEGVTTTTTGSGKKAKTTTTTSGIELFVTNGTAAGTKLVKDINPGFGHSLPSQLLTFNNKLYFTAYTNAAGWELWSSDATAAGTNIVKDLNPGLTGSNPMFLRSFNSALYFNAVASPQDGLRLWMSDGTSQGTVPGNSSIAPGFTGYIPANFDAANGLVFFESEDMEGLKLYRSNGLPGGTFSLGIQQTNQIMQTGEVLTRRAVVGTKVFFTAVNASNGNELYVTDGSIVGTHLVKDIFPGNNPFDPTPMNMIDLNGTLFFTDDDGTHGEELWISNGSAGGTTMVKDLFV